MIASFAHYFRLFLKGMAMGAADIVPGVSGGTIAFVSGIYEELIDSLRNLDWTAVKVLFGDGFAAAWKHINGNFLLVLFLGIITSALSLARLVLYCFEVYPVLIWAFFFGLVLASSFYMARQLGRWTMAEIAALLVGLCFAWLVVEIKPAQLPNDWWVILIAGSVAICAMILPGVSGGFILLILGLYTTIWEGVLNFDVGLIASLATGCIIGLLSFSHLLSWLLHHFHSVTVALLTGFLFGSLNVIWPWKHTIETTVNRHGETIDLVRDNILPNHFLALTGNEPQLGLALLVGIIGALIVLGLEYFASSPSKKSG